jgi:hypothetical protein
MYITSAGSALSEDAFVLHAAFGHFTLFTRGSVGSSLVYLFIRCFEFCSLFFK